jgi:hypothetical protein
MPSTVHKVQAASLVLATLCVVRPAVGQQMGESPLAYHGWGAIRLGMTVADIRKRRFVLAEEPGSDECVEITLQGHDKLRVMLEGNRVTRVSVHAPPWQTDRGVKVGATEAEVKRIYGKHLTVSPHKYDDSGHYLIAKSLSGRFAIVYETDGARVVAIRAGLAAAAQYVEGCL